MSAPEPSVARPGASGLVSYETSSTPTADNANGPRIIDCKLARFSRMQRAVMKSATLHHDAVKGDDLENIARTHKPIMATLTYRPGRNPSKKDISVCLNRVGVWAKRRNLSLRYVWTAELTKRGVLHYHVLFFLPVGRKLPLFDKRGWWAHGMSRLEWARNAVAYIAKYASKGGGTGRNKFPKGFRLHGCGGLSKTERGDRRYHLAPSWVRLLMTRQDDPRPVKGGGWLSLESGEYHQSPYYLLAVSAGRVVIGVHKWFTELTNQLAQEGDQCPA